ncbi:MAG: 5-(carboxyamino)imidazole ribonucleotide mutase [Candidatus Moranbacteria bacterium]|nr:5-(carboxyamino)imidazole ribonucleotide mutase [Candidatus Moranbacteria bacterium]
MVSKHQISVGIVMGSGSDRETMEPAKDIFEKFDVSFAAAVASGHRTRERVEKIVEEYHSRGCRVFIGVAGMAAHLSGILASLTAYPVIGVPICSRPSQYLGGMDALLSTVQMPPGFPVGTMTIDGATNAAIFAIEILALNDPGLMQKLLSYRKKMEIKVLDDDVKLHKDYGWPK